MALLLLFNYKSILKYMNLSKILIPVCKSENCINGLKYASHLAKVKNSELNIVYVTNEFGNGKEELSDIEIRVNELMDDIVFKEIVREGEPSVEILESASELDPE